jgi:hypothetical protein
MAEAEAAQVALLTSGTLAEHAKDNPTLRNILEVFSTTQRLYHKAMLPHVERHQQLSGAPAGLAYAMLCDVLEQPPAKQVGDQITNRELQQLVEQVQLLPPLQAQHSVTLLAIEIANAVDAWPDELSTLDTCVMQDVVSMLAGGSVKSPAAAASPAGGLSGLWESAVSQAGRFARDTVSSAAAAVFKGTMEEALCQAFQAPGSPPEWKVSVMVALQRNMTTVRCGDSDICECCAVGCLLHSSNEHQQQSVSS